MHRYRVIIALCLLSSVFVLRCAGGSPSESVRTIKIIDREKENETPVTCDTCQRALIVPADRSDITCPACGHTRTEQLPTTVCLLKYTCPTCKTVIYPKEGDCCVFCSYGTVKCPSKQ